MTDTKKHNKYLYHFLFWSIQIIKTDFRFGRTKRMMPNFEDIHLRSPLTNEIIAKIQMKVSEIGGRNF